MAEQTRGARKPTLWLLAGLTLFVGLPEGARWLNGGAFAQETFNSLQNTVIGNAVLGHQSYSVTTPGAGSVTGGESNMTVCPGENSPRNVIGTYVPPGGSLNSTVTVTGNSGGSATGYR